MFGKIGGTLVGMASLLAAPLLVQAQDYVIVPGKQIGHVQIGANIKTLDKLGTPNFSDGAMMKAWMTWYSKPESGRPPAELDVYVMPPPGSEGLQKSIAEVRVTSSAFKLAGGIATGSSFATIQHAYPNLKLVKTYSTKGSNGPIRIYDDTRQGIAFEVYRGADGKSTVGRCSAIIVHAPGQTAGDEYLALTEYLKTVTGAAERSTKK